MGDGEKLVRALFAVARVEQPAVIFIDEIDSMLTQRSDGEQEGTRRIKTEFLVQWDGVGTDGADRLLVIGATNRPAELDEAARRRLAKRIYIPLPDCPSRERLIRNLLTKQSDDQALTKWDISEKEMTQIVEATKGYSGADLTELCKDAALGPVRDDPEAVLNGLRVEDMRSILHHDFVASLRSPPRHAHQPPAHSVFTLMRTCDGREVRASVDPGTLESLLDWNRQFGSSQTIDGEDAGIAALKRQEN
jgi:SpoVK/Ycf46/Vps4 family AAA+-type ATPase